jgi:hypothetical protein
VEKAGGLIDEGETECDEGVDASSNYAVEKKLFRH